jgi:hypothetical protein
MIKVYATTEDGQGYVQSLGEYEDIDEIRIYTAALGPNVLITFFDDWTQEEMAHCVADEKEQMTTTDDEDEALVVPEPFYATVGNAASVSANVDCTGKAW